MKKIVGKILLAFVCATPILAMDGANRAAVMPETEKMNRLLCVMKKEKAELCQTIEACERRRVELRESRTPFMEAVRVLSSEFGRTDCLLKKISFYNRVIAAAEAFQESSPVQEIERNPFMGAVYILYDLHHRVDTDQVSKELKRLEGLAESHDEGKITLSQSEQDAYFKNIGQLSKALDFGKQQESVLTSMPETQLALFAAHPYFQYMEIIQAKNALPLALKDQKIF